MIRTKHTSRFLVLLLILALLLSVGASAAGEENEATPDDPAVTDGLSIEALQELIRSVDLAPIREKLASLSPAELFEELKELLAETKELTDEELAEKIGSLAEEYDVTLNETQVSQLVRLCRHYESLSELELKEKFEETFRTLEIPEELREKADKWKEKASEAAEKASEAAEKAEPVFRFFKDGLHKLGDFFMGLFDK